MKRCQFRKAFDFRQCFIGYPCGIFEGFSTVCDAMANAVDLFQTAE